MSLPASFARDGFLEADAARFGNRKHRRLMIGSDGPPDSGKSEFAISAPGPGVVICLDRGFDAVFDNPNPPPTRRNDYGYNLVEVPKATQLAQPGFVEYWKKFYGIFLSALNNAGVRTVVLDGDTDSWELQRLAEFGRTAMVSPNQYNNVNAARRAMYARAFDSGKIVIATNRIRKEYATVYGPDGKPKLNNSGNEVREWTGGYERQGFSDQDYLWQIQLRHLTRQDPKLGQQWGIQVTKCKADPNVVGLELWGDECNFPCLVQAIYPHVGLDEWGL